LRYFRRRTPVGPKTERFKEDFILKRRKKTVTANP